MYESEYDSFYKHTFSPRGIAVEREIMKYVKPGNLTERQSGRVLVMDRKTILSTFDEMAGLVHERWWRKWIQNNT